MQTNITTDDVVAVASAITAITLAIAKVKNMLDSASTTKTTLVDNSIISLLTELRLSKEALLLHLDEYNKRADSDSDIINALKLQVTELKIELSKYKNADTSIK